MSLGDNYHRVLESIAAACAKSGRAAGDVHLIAVSKTHPVAAVDAIAALGQVDFAENRIAELADKKQSAAAKGIRWHLIGQLQTNKVKLLDADVLLHSLDRISLADKLDQRFAALGQKVQALIQVNCSREPNKSGVALADFDALVGRLASAKNIEIKGLMTMAENSTDEKTIRSAFAELRELSHKLAARRVFSAYAGMLSMGMSGDFEYAIAEGATHVRIGSAIFGSR